jgi:hypothetical protein
MPDKRSDPFSEDMWGVERLVMLQLLDHDEGDPLSRQQLYDELYDISPGELDAAVDGLEGVGLLRTSANAIWASPATRRMDELDLIAI